LRSNASNTLNSKYAMGHVGYIRSTQLHRRQPPDPRLSSVEGKLVGSTGQHDLKPRDFVLSGQSSNAVAQRNRLASTLKGKQISTETSDVGSRHGSTAEDSSLLRATDVGALHINAWGNDIDDCSEVGESTWLVSIASSRSKVDPRKESWKTYDAKLSSPSLAATVHADGAEAGV
jgi:hypothetical protein